MAGRTDYDLIEMDRLDAWRDNHATLVHRALSWQEEYFDLTRRYLSVASRASVEMEKLRFSGARDEAIYTLNELNNARKQYNDKYHELYKATWEEFDDVDDLDLIHDRICTYFNYVGLL